jgi:hypothetical protein
MADESGNDSQTAGGQAWSALVAADPELAAFGEARLAGNVAYLATVRKDGSPRVHPVTPIIGSGRLFLFMEPTSPKGRDLRRNGSFALHCAVSDSSGQSGEFFVRGRALLMDNPATRALAATAARYSPKDRYILFELLIFGATSTIYENDAPVRRRWGDA